jgi:uncharacterized protein YhfF
MNFNCLIPEIRVFDLEKSIKFYTEILGFKTEYSRSDFAMVVLGDCQIMLQQLTLPSKKGSWNVTDDMQYPLGRGVNFQIILPDISKVYYSLKKNNTKIFIDLIVSDYKENDIINHVLEFLVQDPDGYLLRFQQDIEDWCFVDNKEMADALFDLVVRGEKTATSYLFDNSINENNGFSILTNWEKTQRAILLTTNKYVTEFDKVTLEHAFKEGEKDKSLKTWKEIHKDFFEKQSSLKNQKFNNNSKIICEEFILVKVLGGENE